MLRSSFCRRTYESIKTFCLHWKRSPSCRPRRSGIPTEADLDGMILDDTAHNSIPLSSTTPLSSSPPALPIDPNQPVSSSPLSSPISDPPFRTTHFPHAAGTPYQHHPTSFELKHTIDRAAGLPLWHPFASQAEWEFAEWIIKSDISQCDTDKLLKSKMYTQLCESGDFATFRNNATFLSIIDSLPDTSAPWNLTEITVEGNLVGADGKPMTETLELWMRDPMQCVADLFGNPAFRDVMAYALVQETEVEEDGNGEDINEEADRFFDEMWSADWWWEAQAALPENATVAPIILASDKTQLSTFSGDKQAWPVYLSIGNINKATRRRPSERATVLLGYLPVSKLLCFHPKDRSNQGHCLFHYAMRQLLAPLISAGKTGAMMTCADGFVRHVFPLLAAYITDHPEQCLVTCCRENRCPKCRVAPGDRGNLVASLHRVQVSALDGIRMCDTNPDPYEADGLRDVPEPFWADLPLVDIFRCITPDMLHQLHKGVFKDHVFKWCTFCNPDEVDARFMCLSPYNNLRHFKKGVSAISQWTGSEHREMEKVFVGILCGLHDESPRILAAARTVIDFIYLTHYPSHSTQTLKQMKAALTSFYANKKVFVDIGAREHFKIAKIHSLLHYIPSIIDFGSCDGVNSEISERLHIDFAKLAYRASNCKGYTKQMVTWLTRRSKVDQFAKYLRWCLHGISESSTSTLYADELIGKEPESLLENLGNENEQDTDFTFTLRSQHCSNSISSKIGQPSDENASMDGDHSDEESEVEDCDEGTPRFGPYRVARHPALGYRTAIEISNLTGALDFEAELKAFFKRENPRLGNDNLASIARSQFALYTSFTRNIGSIRGIATEDFVDRVHARPATAQLLQRDTTPSYG